MDFVIATLNHGGKAVNLLLIDSFMVHQNVL